MCVWRLMGDNSNNYCNMTLLEVNAVLTLLIVVVIIFCSIRYGKTQNRLPGPWNLPVFGYLPWLNLKAPYLSLSVLSKKYGPIYELNLGSVHTVIISDVKLLKKIFLKDSASGRAPLYLIDSIFNGRGIIFAQGNLWKNQRKFIHDFFRSLGANKISQNKNKMELVIMNSALEMVQYIKGKGDDAILNPAETVVHNVSLIMSSIVLGKTWSRDDRLWQQLLSYWDEGSKLLGVAAPLNFLPWLSVLPPFQKNMRFLNDAIATTNSVYKKIIYEKECSTKTNDSASNLVDAFIAEKAKHETASYYTDDQFYSLLSDILGAGLETTVNSLLWFILYMAEYQEVQDKVRRELNDVLQGNRPTLEDMSQTPYTEATIAEVSRIRTVLPLGVPHGISEDIHVDKFLIPKGSMILPLMWAIHMNPEIWNDPEIFRPERFLNNEGKIHRPESFIPFQIGKRMCIGEDLAKMILFLFGATILQTFKIQACSKIDLEGICGLTLTPKPHELTFTKL